MTALWLAAMHGGVKPKSGQSEVKQKHRRAPRKAFRVSLCPAYRVKMPFCHETAATAT